MIKHYITKYFDENGDLVAESWLQINFLWYCFCFSKKKIKIGYIALYRNGGL